MTSLRQYKRLLGYVKPHWKVFALSIFATVVLAATQPAMPYLMKPLLDGSFVSKDPDMIVLMPLALVLLAVIQGISILISNLTMGIVASRVVLDLRTLMIRKLLELPSTFFDTNTTGVVLSKVTYDVEQLTQSATTALVTLVRDSLTIVGLLGLMLYLNWKLTLIAFALIPLVAFFIQIVSKRLRNISKILQNKMGDMTHTLEEVITGNKVIKLFNAQDHERARFNISANKVRQYKIKNIIAHTSSVQANHFLAVVCLALMAYLAAKQSAMGNFTVGEFVAFFGAMAMMLSPLKKLTSINNALQKGIAAAESVFTLIDHPAEPDKGLNPLQAVTGKLEWRNVSLIYPDKSEKALNNISLIIHPGENVALIGPSGSGKTTLANLLPQFYQPTKGEVLIDGRDIRDFPLSQLRRYISLVSQDVFLFNDTIEANIAYGSNKTASQEDILAAAKSANAEEFINSMPEGMQTQIGDNGARLSGGQRQRLAIARAILKDAPILILDEATSALDTNSEKLIQEAMDRLRKGRTTLTIAHRLSTIEHADRIVVLDKGEILETGNHKGLLAENGLYTQLHNLQFSSERNE